MQIPLLKCVLPCDNIIKNHRKGCSIVDLTLSKAPSIIPMFPRIMVLKAAFKSTKIKCRLERPIDASV